MLILSPIIILIKNIFVLRIFTIMIGQILKLFRKLLCMFVILLMTSHHVLPSPLITNSTLHKRQTPLDESENSRNVFTVDDPNEMGNGKIRHKRQECQGGFECDDDQWCYNNMCEYPCPKLACERVHPPDGRCIVRDHQPVCVTAEGLTEQELLKKNGGCTFSSDCGANEWCHNDKCEDPCLKMNCGAIYDNGKCSVENYQPVCKPSDEIINPDDSGSNREKGSRVDVTGFALPISFWYPDQYTTTYTYFSLYILQVIYLYLFAGYMYCGLTSGFMALKITIYDLKFLCLTVQEWDGDNIENNTSDVHCEYGNRLGEDCNMCLKYSENDSSEYDLSSLRAGIVGVIRFHDIICSRASSMNKDFEMMYTILNNTICFQICVCLYSSAKGEKFRTTLWESNFIDKPKWFKSSMLIIMIRIAKELEIKPFGFYVLNLRTFSMVMKAAYSYYSMLNSLKKRI
ncbi:uncharacterized protein LOC111049996 isoform X2 [Nilaparvata lugens]|uniref:uncharacterized protein LOC111049996 isoform X2 n=1 Tax=Nilaparvata lugens TaxID=108931 RepID=UPI00193DAF1F|nr:uncharacterized protein LOC111049996 isoform X2 [Nilaparvata lugens]